MDRRIFLSVLSLGAQSAPHGVAAQSTGKVQRIGYLSSSSSTSGFHESCRQGLRELGWIEGQNIAIEYRFADGRFDRLPELAAELVQLKVDVIVAQPTPPALAAKNATGTIPIVMISVADPVKLGLIASLARPAGNVTGTSYSVDLETFAKGLELLKEAIPKMRRVAVLSNPANPAQTLAINYLKVAAQSLGLQLVLQEARGPDEFYSVFTNIAKERVDALLVVAESVFIVHRARLADLALRTKLPSMHGVRENVQAGALMSYGPSLTYNSRRVATYVDKILKGAKPADLPVEQPTKFELVINVKTAKALGLTIPQSLLLRADEVIQ
jgi:putative tryptophan/tyrosine transport system substrate-binding protein